MNRKYDALSKFSFRKAISFKTATAIVIGVHVLGFFGMTQWSAYKTAVSREKRQAEYVKRMELAETEKHSWPEKTLKVVATSPAPKPSSVAVVSQQPSNSLFDKIVTFFSVNTKPSTVSMTADANIKQIDYDKKMAEATTLIDQATALLSQKAKTLAALEAALKEKQKQFEHRTSDQQKIAITNPAPQSSPTYISSNKTKIAIKSYKPTQYVSPTRSTSSPTSVRSQTVSSPTTVRSETVRSYTRTVPSPTIVSPETVRTYTKNGMQYIDVVDTAEILSSHIVLQ